MFSDEQDIRSGILSKQCHIDPQVQLCRYSILVEPGHDMSHIYCRAYLPKLTDAFVALTTQRISWVQSSIQFSNRKDKIE